MYIGITISNQVDKRHGYPWNHSRVFNESSSKCKIFWKLILCLVIFCVGDSFYKHPGFLKEMIVIIMHVFNIYLENFFCECTGSRRRYKMCKVISVLKPSNISQTKKEEAQCCIFFYKKYLNLFWFTSHSDTLYII